MSFKIIERIKEVFSLVWLKLKPKDYVSVTKTKTAAHEDFGTSNLTRKHQLPADSWYRTFIWSLSYTFRWSFTNIWCFFKIFNFCQWFCIWDQAWEQCIVFTTLFCYKKKVASSSIISLISFSPSGLMFDVWSFLY